MIVRTTVTMLRILRHFLQSGRASRHSGYSISKDLALNVSTVWDVLHRLEEAAWLSSEFESSTLTGRPARRLYRLTDDGRRKAEIELARLQMAPMIAAAQVSAPVPRARALFAAST